MKPDEGYSFLVFTHPGTLDNNLKKVSVPFGRFAEFEGKLIVRDALVHDNTFECVEESRCKW